jgi:hypothetical protein
VIPDTPQPASVCLKMPLLSLKKGQLIRVRSHLALAMPIVKVGIAAIRQQAVAPRV